jgi:uncharacterized MAPEG superfamily protein
MNIAHLMVLIAALLPYLTVGGAKAQPAYDNSKPRDSLATLAGWRARANWAHQNHFEAFAPFATAVILAEIAHASQSRIDALAVAFVVIRVAYTAAYLSNAASVRTLIWIAGLACVVWLFVLSI